MLTGPKNAFPPCWKDTAHAEFGRGALGEVKPPWTRLMSASDEPLMLPSHPAEA
jgi:hypothetical protein